MTTEIAVATTKSELELLEEFEQGILEGPRALEWVSEVFACWDRVPNPPSPVVRAVLLDHLFQAARDFDMERANHVLRELRETPHLIVLLEEQPSVAQFLAFGSFSPNTFDDVASALLRCPQPPKPQFWLSTTVNRFRTWRTRFDLMTAPRESDRRWARVYTRVLSRLIHQGVFQHHSEHMLVKREYEMARSMEERIRK